MTPSRPASRPLRGIPKSVDARSTQSAVELKVPIEQMREQVRNIE